ncbi:hypothetical protein [Fibrobacter succinogenes]|uniref:hypothetical protein n=1 Tax=Fibrobacter succinogenes TaxID=833 RepID=UPI0015689A67|nr:hypothetical protein [Fibrobacter succinogenes]
MKKLKYPSTAMVREKLGAGSKIAKRIYALEKWAVSHGYDGYAPIQRRTKKDKLQQVSMAFYGD